MIKTAEQYVGVDKAGKSRLFDYYNQNCYPLVEPTRKYRMKPGDNWCAMFTSVIAHKEGMGSDVFPYEVSVMQQLKWAQANGRFTRDAAQTKPGDLVLYTWKQNGHCDHVGMLVSRKGGSLVVLEGNKSDTVGYRTVSEASKSIHGYVRIG